MHERPEVRYLPCHCAFLKREVWAIVTKQADGKWQVVNCLDKDTACFEHPCAFTADGGQWPFAGVPFHGCRDLADDGHDR